ncbi:MAG: PASTA domain-containing protein [Proteobacteria bacterium]|nr:PASTA domain-containing protein [Pseudomonadota bacterium]MBU4469692.1 PASTA domain-containing protein [Pseudomonadota bacterium]MCG2751775.1 PASTA domain-containing protein [Desulfobacteraceae bacterium]
MTQIKRKPEFVIAGIFISILVLLMLTGCPSNNGSNGTDDDTDPDPTQVSVPGVTGLTQAAAETAITAANLTVGTVASQSSDTVAAGSVISQTPAAGTSVDEGSAVNILVSSGPAQVSVPGVTGITQAAAEAAITGADLTVGIISTQNSDTVAAGLIISQTPAAGTSVDEGSAVNILVSSGPAQVSVPNVTGITQAAAEAAITGANLTVGIISTQNSNVVATGSVISQNPPAGTSVNEGSAVNILVSSGPAQVSVPNVTGMTQATAETVIATASLTVGTVTTQNSDTVTAGLVISQNPIAGTSVNEGSAVNLVISLGPDTGLPPEPADVASALDPNIATALDVATAFLYTGSNPIQTGMAADTIDPVRAAVIRGRVLDPNNDPLSGVTITILNHPEFGQTLTREANGMFDMAINGGGSLIVNYEKTDFLPVQRQVDVPWLDYAHAPDVVMIALDSNVTAINLTAPEIQVHRSSEESDSDGTRKVTMLFMPGTTAEMVLPDNSTQTLNTLNIRATEYTVGESGQLAMPGDLPAHIAYTYCVELSIDEALSSGATRVHFNQPAVFYVDDIVGFGAGCIVPLGYYDRQTGQWVGEKNAIVLDILSISEDLAQVDTDGDGVADSAARLAELGISDAERSKLAGLYPSPPYRLWRAGITHLTPFDCNFPYIPPADATRPSNKDIDDFDPEPDDCTTSGSIIQVRNRSVGQILPIAGTEFKLHYASSRVKSFGSAYTLHIPLSDATVPGSLKGMVCNIDVAGQKWHYTFNPEPNRSMDFTWNGLDAYGRTPIGPQPITVKRGFQYELEYVSGIDTGDYEKAWSGTVGAMFYALNPQSRNARGKFTLWSNWKGRIGAWNAEAWQLGGWSLNVQHFFDPVSGYLILGDGRWLDTATRNDVNTICGGGSSFPYPIDASLPLDFRMGVIPRIAAAADGALYITAVARVLRLAPDGLLYTMVNMDSVSGCTGGCGDGGPAVDGAVRRAVDVAVTPDGSLYIADDLDHRVRRVGPDGIITTVAGNGQGSVSFDTEGITATDCPLTPYRLACAKDGTVYILDRTIRKVLRLMPDGRLYTAAGDGSSPSYLSQSQDDVPANEAGLVNPSCIEVTSDGVLLIGSFRGHIRSVGTDGIITTYAGQEFQGYEGDGGLAVDAKLGDVYDLCRSESGSIYIADPTNDVIRKIQDGIITTVVGNGTPGYSPDGVPAAQCEIDNPNSIAVFSNGRLCFSCDHTPSIDYVIRAMQDVHFKKNGASWYAPSEDGRQMYMFDSRGYHLLTQDTLTDAILYRFNYDAYDRLISVDDRNGNKTLLYRDGDGAVTRIVSADGIETLLNQDGNGFLSSIEYQGNRKWQFTYSDIGLMTSAINPNDKTTRYQYTSNNLLERVDYANGSFKTLTKTIGIDDDEIVLTTAMGYETRYRKDNSDRKNEILRVYYPNGTTKTKNTTSGQTQTVSYGDGTVITEKMTPDPRFGMLSPISGEYAMQMPSGLTHSISWERETDMGDPLDPTTLNAMTVTRNINGNNWTSEYGAVSRTLTRTTPEGRKSIITLDEKGRTATAAYGGLALRTLTYDANGRLSQATAGSGEDTRIYQFTYDGDGQLSGIIDPLNRQTFFTYSNGQLMGQTMPDNRVYSYTRDANGNYVSYTNALNETHSFTRDDKGAIIGYDPPDIGLPEDRVQTLLNLDSMVTDWIRPDGQTINYIFNSYGLLSRVSMPSGDIRYAYDPISAKRTEAVSPDGITVRSSWDGLLPTRLEWSGAIAGSVDFAYDSGLRIIRQTINEQYPVNFGFDADGLLVQSKDITLQREAESGRIVQTDLNGLKTLISYNTFGEATGVQAFINEAPFFEQSFVRDKLGRITQKTESINGSTFVDTYEYNLAGWLKTVTRNGNPQASYEYDANGNRTHSSVSGIEYNAVSDAQDRITQFGEATYGYNAHGERLNRTAGTMITSYHYNSLGHLKTVQLPSGVEIEYLLDGTNRVMGKRKNGVLVHGFVYSGSNQVLAQLDGSGNLDAIFVYGQQDHVPDYMIKDGVNYRFIKDSNGSVRLVVHALTGSVAQEIMYDSFGNIVSDSAPGFQPFAFAGGLYDSDTGLLHMGARVYDPETGKWMTRDPLLMMAGSPNLYTYCLNDPINRVDPHGLFSDDCQSMPDYDDLEKALRDILEAIENADPEELERLKNETEKLLAEIAKNRRDTVNPIDALASYGDALLSSLCFGLADPGPWLREVFGGNLSVNTDSSLYKDVNFTTSALTLLFPTPKFAIMQKFGRAATLTPKWYGPGQASSTLGGLIDGM